MYINLRNCLTINPPKVDLSKLSYSDQFGNVCFNWADGTYYPKFFNLNELIGEQLAKKINHKTVEFKIFQDKNGECFIASKSCIKPCCSYYHPLDFKDICSKKDFDSWKDICLDEDNVTTFMNDIFGMFSVDTYMKQQDRSSNILIEKYDTGYIALFPLFDYSEADWYNSIRYNNIFYTFYTEDDYKELYTKYPYFLKSLKQIQKVDMQKNFEDIEFSKGILLPSNVKDIYLKREEISQKKLEKIIK